MISQRGLSVRSTSASTSNTPGMAGMPTIHRLQCEQADMRNAVRTASLPGSIMVGRQPFENAFAPVSGVFVKFSVRRRNGH
eukprot:scaffold2570_cov436-Prasinococcus_capsulatus_cf.AAC.6